MTWSTAAAAAADKRMISRFEAVLRTRSFLLSLALYAEPCVRQRCQPLPADSLPATRAYPKGAVGQTRQRFVYFPLHVPADMALTIRSPGYLDQIALIDYLLRVMPLSHTLVIKEHPAQIGAIPAARMQQLLKRYDNLKVLPPKTNNYAVLADADAVVSVNSKSGAEALLLGKSVVVLGDAFYTTCPLVLRADRRSDLSGRLSEALARPKADTRQVAAYFQTAWDLSFPGELYTDNQVEAFCRSIVAATAGSDASSLPATHSATAAAQSR